jgi:hypothetical protein
MVGAAAAGFAGSGLATEVTAATGLAVGRLNKLLSHFIA